MRDAIQKAREALDEARKFIAAEYADASAEMYGEWLASEARPVFDKICRALAALDAETPATPADVGEEPVAPDIDWVTTAHVFCDRLGIERKAEAEHICTALERVTRERDALRARLETVEAETRERCAKVAERAHAAPPTTAPLSSYDYAGVYRYATAHGAEIADAIRNLEPRHD